MWFVRQGLLLSSFLLYTEAVSLPRTPETVTVRSNLDPLVSLSYKETKICETTPGVKSYSGYVHLRADPSVGRPYDINTFFWFFEARKDAANAPLSLWLQGGPGSPSIPAALGENGPCYVAADSKNTRLNPWSWNSEVNMLYIDQPVQTGFSYDRLVNGTIDETRSPYTVNVTGSAATASSLNSTLLAGVFSSQDPASTANTTLTAAEAAWNFMQVWMKEFPGHKPKDHKFSIWSESFGGHYGPTFANFFEKQNAAIAKGNISDAITMKLDTVGIINGCVDILTQIPAYPQMAFNNTYGLKAINETEYKAALDSFPACQKSVMACRTLADAKDPLSRGNNADVNKACSDAFKLCFGTMARGVQDRQRNVFDITAMVPGSFPPKYAAGYLNSREVQQQLGVPLNFTGLSPAVNHAFDVTGEFVLGKTLDMLGALLDNGVKVALVYGDKDYQCNWYGGEMVSLAIKSKFSQGFQKSGYAEIHTNKSYVGGYVRQHGNLSFSRVLDAGHEAPWYQPETAYQIFKRVMFNTDVASGKIHTNTGCSSGYSTTGPANVNHILNNLKKQPVSECYVWDIAETCSPTQTELLRDGKAIVKDFIMVGYNAANGTAIHY